MENISRGEVIRPIFCWLLQARLLFAGRTQALLDCEVRLEPRSRARHRERRPAGVWQLLRRRMLLLLHLLRLRLRLRLEHAARAAAPLWLGRCAEARRLVALGDRSGIQSAVYRVMAPVLFPETPTAFLSRRLLLTGFEQEVV